MAGNKISKNRKASPNDSQDIRKPVYKFGVFAGINGIVDLNQPDWRKFSGFVS
jgi:hypothetical protein